MSEIRKQSKEIIIKMMEENPVVIDNHTGKERPITGLVEFVNPDKLLACCFDVKYYSLNPCILDEDNKLHCVEYSIGGDLWSSYPTEEQLRDYNSICEFDSQKIKCIHRPDGTKVYPAS